MNLNASSWIEAPWAASIVAEAAPLAVWALCALIFAARAWGPLFYPRAPPGVPQPRPPASEPEHTADVVVIVNAGGDAAIGTAQPRDVLRTA